MTVRRTAESMSLTHLGLRVVLPRGITEYTARRAQAASMMVAGYVLICGSRQAPTITPPFGRAGSREAGGRRGGTRRRSPDLLYLLILCRIARGGVVRLYRKLAGGLSGCALIWAATSWPGSLKAERRRCLSG